MRAQPEGWGARGIGPANSEGGEGAGVDDEDEDVATVVVSCLPRLGRFLASRRKGEVLGGLEEEDAKDEGPANRQAW